MRDDAHIWTTERIINLEFRIQKIYKDALASANRKFNEFNGKFKLKNKIHIKCFHFTFPGSVNFFRLFFFN